MTTPPTAMFTTSAPAASPGDGEEEDRAALACRTFEFVVCGVLIGIICLVGVAGNITSFVVLWKHKTQTATILVFQGLACSDTVLLLVSWCVYVLPLLTNQSGGTAAKVVLDIATYVWPVGMMAHTATVWLTVVVTAHRFFCVCKPLGIYVRNNVPFIRIHILIVLSFSVIFNVPRFFEHHTIYWQETSEPFLNDTINVSVKRTHEIVLGDDFYYQLIYSNIIYFPVMYIIPLVSLVYLSSHLSQAVRNLHSRKRQKLNAASGGSGGAKKDNITVCIIVIVIVFVLCQTPALINQIFWAALGQEERQCGKFHFYYTKLCDLLVIVNSSANFAIYCLFGKSFRKIFLKTMKQTFCFAKISQNCCRKSGPAQQKQEILLRTTPKTASKAAEAQV